MNDQLFTLTTANAMGVAAQQTSDSAMNMKQRLETLIADMEKDASAVGGNSLPAFRAARRDLNEAFAGLIRWCSENGVQLEEGQQDAITTDDQGQAGYAAARGGGIQING